MPRHALANHTSSQDSKSLYSLRFVQQLRRTLLATACLTMAACGGGGGGSRNPAPTPPTPPPSGNEAPVASFSLSSTSGNAPLLVNFDASGSTDSDGTVTSYAWDFDEAGATAIGQNAQHTYSDEGSYSIALTVTDDEGATNTTSRTLTVNTSAGTATLSGTITILSSSAIDADVNDRLTTGGDNNSFANAQNLPLPVTLGGFANVPNSGADTGNLFASGDPGDFYQLNFSGNETILLTIAEANADLDIRLYDAGQNLVDSGLGTGRTEVVQVTTPGSYFIEVYSVNGASNYVLNVGQDLTTNQLGNDSASRLTDPFVAGDIILQRQPGAVAANATTTTQAQIRNQFDLTLASNAGVTQLTRLSPTTTSQTSATQSKPGDLPSGAIASPEAMLRFNTLMRVKQINRTAGAAVAEVNLLRQATAIPNDSFYNRQWHYENINLPTAWDTTTGSSNVIVAVVDTGVLTQHPDLSSQLVPGYDFISDASRANDGDGIDNDPNDPGDNSFGGSSSFHGTHVAGTIAAQSNNNIGVAGVAWLSRIMPVRALGVNGGTNFDVIQAMRFAAGLSNDSNTTPAQRADIINLSLGSEFSSQSEQATINEIINAGVIVVASAGNSSSSLPSYPAAYDGVISVSATTISNTLASYSNTGSTIDVAAPGGSTSTDLNGDGIGDGVVSTIGDDGGGSVQFSYAALQGTSMAAPHVAGVAALMKAVHPGLTPTQFNNALLSGDLTDDLGSAGRDDNFGYGLINAQKSVVAAQSIANGNGSDPGPILSASASSLNFGTAGTALTWSLQNIGTGTLTVSDVSADENWATATEQTVDGNGLGDYRINVDRTGLADGTYNATITATSNSNNLTLRILMQVSSVVTTADAGLHYVIVVDEAGNSDVPAAVVQVNNGVYTYSIADVPFGEYELFGGSDSDDDNFLCDGGEACGAYRTLDSPDSISVNGDITGLDFTTTFRSTLGSLAAGANNGADASDATGIPLTKPATAGPLNKSKVGSDAND